MSNFEYKVIPAPRKPEKVKGVRANDIRFAVTITNTINTLGEDGWEYLRAESLPVDEKSSMMGKPVERYQSLLVFRREKVEIAESGYTPTPLSEEKSVSDQSMLSALSDDETEVEIAPLGAASRD